MENIITLLTSEDKDEIRESIKDIVINQIRNDFESYGSYLFDPSQIEDMTQEIIEELKEEFKDMYREKLMKEMENKLNSLI